MLRPDMSARPGSELIQRAAETSLNSARIIARSIETIMRSIEISQVVARAYERAGTTQAETLRAKAWAPRRIAKPRAAWHIERVRPLPLTPPRLLELAEEFRALAMTAATPESRAAFFDLVFRYTALAAGYDAEQTGSQMLH
jgi:hypothetical protein